MTYEILMKNYTSAKEELTGYLHSKIEEELDEVEKIIKIAKGIEDIEYIDDYFSDFHIRLETDSSYSDYFNIVTFLCIHDGEISVGKGVWDGGDYDYNSYSSDELPDDISDLESILSSIIQEFSYMRKNIDKELEEKKVDKK
ncbi:MAG: hypothetical protein ACRDCW_02780 [Sarcina sp.]